uniref:TF-B3 domain-containing protein n=1 Tax=Ananas comosus var. bracteatus TaxID=296719 RepID=A0A6V7QDW0_ANACO|nr:unnamed protein product [Ananas comosus var. bracteatus]
MKKISGKSCKECEKWEEHFYWNHLDEHKMHFFKVMVEDFTKCMSIPKKFVDNFNGQISNVVDLKTPSGDIWKIGVTKSQDNIILQSGWTEFIAAHQIEKNDLLFFTCNGNSSFEVAICDDSGCEKASPFFAKKDACKTGEGDGATPAQTRNEGNRRRKVIELCSSAVPVRMTLHRRSLARHYVLTARRQIESTAMSRAMVGQSQEQMRSTKSLQRGPGAGLENMLSLRKASNML